MISISSQFPLFTEDRYRSSYTPHTTPEETFDGWDISDIPVPPVYANETAMLQKHQEVESFLNEWNTTHSSIATIVRCPVGWQPIGPFCMTMSVVQPYTQCPMDLKRFSIGPGNPVIPISELPGLCQRHEFTGLIFECPQNFNLVLHRETETAIKEKVMKDDDDPSPFPPLSYSCEMDHRIPYTSLDGSCPQGFTSSPHEGCVAHQRLQPEASCPSGFALHSFVVNTYAFYGRQRLECAGSTRIKGKLWCPEGYSLSGEYFQNIPFGTILDANQTSASPPFELSAEAKSFSSDGSSYQSAFKALDLPFCFKILTVLWNCCNRLECSTRYLHHLRHVLIDWGYKLEIDPEFVVYAGIPSGRDFRFTNTGAALNDN